MVIRLLPVMEDDELAALRLAALQTLKPRNFERKKNYGNQFNHNYHQNAQHHHNSKPFIRMDRNPNLIVIIPTEVKEEKRKTPDVPSEPSSVTKNGAIPEKPVTPTSEDRTQEREPEPTSNAEESPEKSKKQVPSRFKRESRDDELELDFDEEELDFESEGVDGLGQDDDCIALHADENDTLALDVDDSDKLALHGDDDDSLDKLMDEMEQEFSGNVSPKTTKKAAEPVKKDVAETRKSSPPAKEALPVPKSAAPSLKDKSAVMKNKPSPVPSDRKPSPTRHSPPPATRSRSPNVYSETARTKSPTRRSRSPVYRRSRSPRPLLARRSPLPRRSSRSPLPRRSRSPLPPRRSKSPYRRGSPYRRSKSPLHRRSSPRRLSPLPRRSPRRSPLPLSRRSRSRSRSAPRREYRSRSPLPPRRRTPSPYHRRSLSADRRRPLTRRSASPRRRSPTPTRGNVRRRTPPPPRRSPPPARRSPLPARSIRRRSASPGRRPLPRRSPIRRQPREPRAARPADLDSRSRLTANTERRRSPVDNRSELNSRKDLHTKSRSDEESERNKPFEPVEEGDPKLEARRRKFESITVVSGTQKKICLKSSSDDARAKGEDSPASPTKEGSTEEVEELDNPSQGVVSRTQQSSLFNRIGRGNIVEDRGHQARVTANTTKDTQTKRLPGLFDEEDEQEEKKSKPAIRYTVEDAKEEIELMKLRRKRKTERILNEEGENHELLHTKKKKKKKDKEKKKEKKRELLLAGMVEAEETIVKVTDRVGVAAAIRAEGTDLRAELSRRRAQRLQGQPGSRLIQSALEGVVADKKIKPMRHSPPADSVSSDDANKTKGRRVQVVAATKKKYTGRDSASDSEELEDKEEAPKTKKMTSAGILRGTTLHRRSQVIKK